MSDVCEITGLSEGDATNYPTSTSTLLKVEKYQFLMKSP